MPKSKREKIVFIFGAGASYDAGAPVQGDLFKRIFKDHLLSSTNSRDKQSRELVKKFFDRVFGFSDLADLTEYSNFPTFEEVLGILEFAIQNNASFGRRFSQDAMIKLKLTIEYLMAKTIKESLERPRNNNHEIFINKLFEKKDDFSFSFVNLNYDILLDSPLFHLSKQGISVDHGFEPWRNYLDETWEEPDKSTVPLLKPHGSLNWFYCPSCNSIYLNTAGKVGFRSTEIEPDIPNCKYCRSKQTLFIIPPTFFKSLSNVHTTTILQRIQKEVANSEFLVFVGYSFPDADLHLKYLIKKAIQLYPRQKKPLRVIVIEQFFDGDGEDAPPPSLLDVYKRYARMFKEMNFLTIGFENFANNPYEYLLSSKDYHMPPEKLDFRHWHHEHASYHYANYEDVEIILNGLDIPRIFGGPRNIDITAIPDFENSKFLISTESKTSLERLNFGYKEIMKEKTNNPCAKLILVTTNLLSNSSTLKKFNKVFYFEELSEFKKYMQKIKETL